LRLSIRDAGLTDSAPSPEAHDDPFWELEPTPLILPPEEWQLLENAIRQRARLVNCFLHDIYDRQEAVADGIVPPEFVLNDPYFRRPCLGLTPDRLDPATLVRFDLIKTAEGWVFGDTYTNAPVGISYVVQNRRFLTQEAGDFYRELPDYESVINYPLELVDTLRSLAPPHRRRPTVVFLTTGPRYPFFSEHSFLARKMGLRLAQGDDLLVLDNKVYFKTVGGLERVDVIYRRVNDAHIDPVVFSTDFETAGIPGLMQCIRAGNVAVANAIGAGVAENRALHAYLPGLARYYFGERLVLPSIPTYLCSDNDHLDRILELGKDLSLLPIHLTRQQSSPQTPPKWSGTTLPRVVRENPGAFVGQPHLKSVPLNPGARKRMPFRLSAYALTQGTTVSVLPGGIINLGKDEPPQERVGVCADVIVLAGEADTAGSLADFETAFVDGAIATVPGSRTAESLFWLGRYLERSESTARMLHILDDVALEEIPSRERRRWLPLWRGLLEATGQTDRRIDLSPGGGHRIDRDLKWHLALGPDNPGALLASVRAAASNARELRQELSPEAGTILSRLERQLWNAARESPTGRSKSARAARNRAVDASIQAVLTESNACFGALNRTMLQDSAWHFILLGVQLERAIITATALRHVLPVTAKFLAADPAHAAQHYRDNPELSALLRMLGSQDAYRRLYRTRSLPAFVADLFLQQPDAPRSIAHNLHQFAESLAAIHEANPPFDGDPVGDCLTALRDYLAKLNITHHFETPLALTPDAPDLGEVLQTLFQRLLDLHPLLSDHFFSHQAHIAPPAEQSEIEF